MSTAADVLIDTIHQWGVEVIFGMPGDGIRGIMDALEKRQNRIRFIKVRHEEAAALMACGYAKYTGKIGVCLGSSGQGGIHLLSGLYDAKLDGQPVLALTGTQIRDLTDTFGQQDVALDRVFMDVAIYNTRIMGPGHVENVAGLACRAAVSQRGVAHITFPVDIQSRSRGRAQPSALPPSTAPAYLPNGRACRMKVTCARPPRSSTRGRRSPSWPAAAPWAHPPSWNTWPRCWVRPL